MRNTQHTIENSSEGLIQNSNLKDYLTNEENQKHFKRKLTEIYRHVKKQIYNTVYIRIKQ